MKELLTVARRRWWVLAVGVLATMAVSAVLIAPRPLYATKNEVLLVRGSTTPDLAYLWGSGEDLVPFTEAIEFRLNGPTVRLNSMDASPSGIGIRDGVRIQMENLGNQWSESFKRPVLVVEAVADSPEEAIALRHDALQRIEAVLLETQQSYGVSPDAMTKSVTIPADSRLSYVGQTNGGRLRALAAAAALGLALTVRAALVVDRSLNRRGTARVGAAGRVAEPVGT